MNLFCKRFNASFRSLIIACMVVLLVAGAWPGGAVSHAFAEEEEPEGAATTVTSATYDAGAGSLVNLALGKSVDIATPYAHFDEFQNIGYGLESDATDAWKLTNGNYGNLGDFTSVSEWFVFYRKLQRVVTVDLEDVNTVNQISIRFGQNSPVGIVPPINVRYYVSNDGVDYRYLGLAEPDVPLYFAEAPGNRLHLKEYRITELADGTPLNAQARYVKLVFTIATFGWADEIEIMGKEGIVDGATLPESQPDAYDDFDEYAKPGVVSSAEITDQFLWYSGPMADPYFTDWTEEKVMSFLGYIGIDGSIDDWFFDDILAIPVVQMLTPSGFDKNGSAVFKTKEDMLAFIDFIFQQDTQFGAINSAAGKLNNRLGTQKKVRVNMSIPYITENSDFGDIIGDGSKLSLLAEDFKHVVNDPESMEGKLEMHRLAVENKKRAVQWYIDEVERRFAAAGYEHLTLNSFYWYGERLWEDKGDVQVIQATADYLKAKDYYFTWIPYLGLNQAHTWRDLGFTTGAIQPNFAFNLTKKAVFPKVSELAKQLGSSVEIEYDDYRTLVQYLNAGYKEGFMAEAYNTYYMAAMPIAEGAYAYTPFHAGKHDALAVIRRAVYDRIYEYAKGTYVPRYAMTLVTNLTNKADIPVQVMLPLADSFVEGEFMVHYDMEKVSFFQFDIPASLQGKGLFQVDASQPGQLRIQFKLDEASDAIFADLQERRNPMKGAPELLTLRFSKKAGVDEELITTQSFVIDEQGQMKDVGGAVYLNFTASDFVSGSMEEAIAKAHQAVLRAESSGDYADVDQAWELVKQLPDMPIKSSLIAQLDKVVVKLPIKVELISQEKSFRLGEDAKVTVQATNVTDVEQTMTFIVALYDTSAKSMVTYSAIQQKLDTGKTIEATGMLKIPKAGQYEMRAFVWDTLDHMRPMSGSITISIVE